MTLKMVTWDGDLTQFLVDAETDKEAIYKAMESNRIFEVENYGVKHLYDLFYIEFMKDLLNEESYKVDDVDLNLLFEIIKRNDWIGVYGEALVFND